MASDNQTSGAPKKRMILWQVRDYESGGEKKSHWNRVGIAFENRDGSWSLQFNSMPLDGRVQMRPPRQEDGD